MIKKVKSYDEVQASTDDMAKGYKPTPIPQFEIVTFATESGLKYIDGYYLVADVEKASKKFQKALKNYQFIALDSDTYEQGPNTKMVVAYRTLMRLGKEEKILYYSLPEQKKYIEDFHKAEELRRKRIMEENDKKIPFKY